MVKKGKRQRRASETSKQRAGSHYSRRASVDVINLRGSLGKQGAAGVCVCAETRARRVVTIQLFTAILLECLKWCFEVEKKENTKNKTERDALFLWLPLRGNICSELHLSQYAATAAENKLQTFPVEAHDANNPSWKSTKEKQKLEKGLGVFLLSVRVIFFFYTKSTWIHLRASLFPCAFSCILTPVVLHDCVQGLQRNLQIVRRRMNLFFFWHDSIIYVLVFAFFQRKLWAKTPTQHFVMSPRASDPLLGWWTHCVPLREATTEPPEAE